MSETEQNKQASTKPSKSSERNTDTNPEGGPDLLLHGSSLPEFKEALFRMLSNMTSPAALARIVSLPATSDKPTIEPMLVLKDDWQSDKPDCVKLYLIIAYCPDLIEMHHYRTHDAIAIVQHVPLTWIKGFKWASETETSRFLDIHQFKETN